MNKSEFIFGCDGEPTFNPASYARRSRVCHYDGGASLYIALAGLALTAAGTGAGLYMQSEQAAQTEDYNKAMSKRQGEVIAQNYEPRRVSRRLGYVRTAKSA